MAYNGPLKGAFTSLLSFYFHSSSSDCKEKCPNFLVATTMFSLLFSQTELQHVVFHVTFESLGFSPGMKQLQYQLHQVWALGHLPASETMFKSLFLVFLEVQWYSRRTRKSTHIQVLCDYKIITPQKKNPQTKNFSFLESLHFQEVPSDHPRCNKICCFSGENHHPLLCWEHIGSCLGVQMLQSLAQGSPHPPNTQLGQLFLSISHLHRGLMYSVCNLQSQEHLPPYNRQPEGWGGWTPQPPQPQEDPSPTSMQHQAWEVNTSHSSSTGDIETQQLFLLVQSLSQACRCPGKAVIYSFYADLHTTSETAVQMWL